MREMLRALWRFACLIATVALVILAGHWDAELAAQRACERDGRVELFGESFICQRADAERVPTLST